MICFEFNVGENIANTVTSGSTQNFCSRCQRARTTFLYKELCLKFHKPRLRNEWPMVSKAGIYHGLFQECVVQALKEAKITGLSFHKVGNTFLDEEAVEDMPPLPTYYVIEPIGMIDFVIPEEEYHKPCDECGHLKAKRFGDPKEPFQFLKETWDGSDVVRIRNHWQHIFFVNRKVIDVFRKNNWHHQIAYGTQNRKYESLSFGGRMQPGLTIANIDSENWYEELVMALKNELLLDFNVVES